MAGYKRDIKEKEFISLVDNGAREAYRNSVAIPEREEVYELYKSLFKALSQVFDVELSRSADEIITELVNSYCTDLTFWLR